jgi:hypothetical protein
LGKIIAGIGRFLGSIDGTARLIGLLFRIVTYTTGEINRRQTSQTRPPGPLNELAAVQDNPILFDTIHKKPSII